MKEFGRSIGMGKLLLGISRVDWGSLTACGISSYGVAM